MELPRSSQEPMPISGPAPSDPAAAYQPIFAESGGKLDLTSDPVPVEIVDPPLAEQSDSGAIVSAPPRPARPYRRRVGVPLFLFLLTCFSTFLAGATGFWPAHYFLRAVGILGPEPSLMPLRRAFYTHWEDGLIYMGCVLAILLTHEMGHFLMALLYRVRASLPYFLPLPISPIGTMGAVIALDGRTANRREIFDIGLAGPIAGLVVALPIMWYGVLQMDLTPAARGDALQLPLAMQIAIDYIHPGKYDAGAGFSLSQTNPWFMAGWVGLLVTGLNMLPVSQLDGGHVTYALFGRKAHWLARGFMLVAFGYMIFMLFAYGIHPGWVLMIVLVLVMGTDHPPTRDDTAPLGWFRIALGYSSLLIPIFCFVPNLQL